MKTRTTFDEGESAGFLGLGREFDPFRTDPDKQQYSLDWHAGYTRGEENARDLLYEKRLNFVRGGG